MEMRSERTIIQEPSTLVDFAYDNIRRDIAEEILHAGDKVNLPLLCKRYGISPTPIKQALNRLIVEGLIENIPRKGYRIRRVNWQEIDELFELRLMIELYFAPHSTLTVENNVMIQDRFTKNLEANLTLVQNFTTQEEYFQTYELDQQFHELYILASGNQAALRTYKSLNTHTYAAFLFGKQPKEKTVDGVKEHQMIYQAMLNGDVEEVRRCVELHNKNARTKINTALKMNTIMVE